jgi:CspA family cold shock protein
MVEGKVKFYTDARGFGFIARDDGQPDVFMHIHAWTPGPGDLPAVGDRVQFLIETDAKSGRPRAASVERA